MSMLIVPTGLLPFLPQPLASPPQIPRSFPMHVNPHRYTLFPLSVYSHMLIPINLFLIGAERREGGACWRVCVGLRGQWRWVGRARAHTLTRTLTDCARPGLLFTLSRCGLPLVLLCNYPSLSESMCQSNSLESESRVWARAGRDRERQGDL